jgi:cell division protease FtsH
MDMGEQRDANKSTTNEWSLRSPPWRTEGVPPPPPPPSGKRSFRPTSKFWLVLAGLLIANWLIGAWVTYNSLPTTIPYTEFRQELKAGNVAEVRSRGDIIQGTFKQETTVGQGAETRKLHEFRTVRPTYAQDDLLTDLDRQGVTVLAQPPEVQAPLWQQLLAGFGPTLLFVGLWVYAMRRTGGGLGGNIFGFGKARAKRVDREPGRRATFDDVAGIDEVKGELSEIVDMLRHTDRYRRLGARMPSGVLLSGPPGTGKTLLARAVAGEAGVPFFAASASEFIEMIVGVGASRVRDLFEEARKVAPAIIFIDEIDAIGRARSAGSFGGVDEREQTLNQILTEMDGFTGSEGVIVIAATNRPELLDPALLRPGRFDRRIVVNPPDAQGRQAILRIHTRGVPLAPSVDLENIAAITPGATGAELRNLVNEAALLAARRGHDKVEHNDFTDALEKIILGVERDVVIPEAERRRTAYHESGHALLGMLVPGADPVRKVSIIPRGQALGVTLQTPEADRYGYTESSLRARIIGALGGRAAEEVVFGDVTTGAENDLENLTRTARMMVGRWGMSPLVGPVSVLPGPEQELAPFGVRTASDQTHKIVDDEVRRIVDGCYAEATSMLREQRAKLDALVDALMVKETLDESEAYAIAGVPAPASTMPSSV